MNSTLSLPFFRQKIAQIKEEYLHPERVETLQINVGDLCNQTCDHCHVSASPNGRKNMTEATFAKILDILERYPDIQTVDITGGAPEMNPYFRSFVDAVLALEIQVMVRTNLTVFFEPGMSDLPNWYAKRKITLVASLPCYTEETVDGQRGEGVFEKSIKALKHLNEMGYGDYLDLSLVYNPSGDFLPGSQVELEKMYRKELYERYEIIFTRLYALANLPVGRFKHFLRKEKRLDSYLDLLHAHFNSESVPALMCRHLISVDWQGTLFHCDFNQQERLPIVNLEGEAQTLDHFDDVLADKLEIVTRPHCYGCTAGEGSSCTGVLTLENKTSL